MDLRKLKTLIDLVSESNISELEITEAEGKVRIVKSIGTAVPAGMVIQPAAGGTTPLAAPVSAAAPEPAPPPVVKTVKSPMVGTFYRAASPGAKPFVELGSEIKVGQAVCIVEAMKIMNEIDSDLEGRITKVLCENGQAVEFGQPLFIVE